MPFKSKAQMRACYARKDPRWNCSQWARETVNLPCLPERVGLPSPCARRPASGRTSPRRPASATQEIFIGPRGGRYYLNAKGQKVYVK